MQFYIDVLRSRRVAEVFYLTDDQAVDMAVNGSAYGFDAEEGWYWWACMPGCLPDDDPPGPFDTEADAIADARSY